jgi:hypothetical protein
METSLKSDFAACMDRVEAWWDGEILDRVPVTIGVKSGRQSKPVRGHHADLRARWMDVEYQVDRAESVLTASEFVAETFPRFFPNLGPEICSCAYGSPLIFTEGSSWSVPVLKNVRDVIGRKPDLENVYWQTIRKMVDLSLQRGAGRWVTTVTDLHTQGDLLASLREPQDFAVDFMDDFEGVQKALQYVAPHFQLFFDDLYTKRILPAGQPCATWGTVISRKKMYYVSCDFICMISPEHFQGAILPAIEHEMDSLDRRIFHLDGPGALKHLDALLATKLHAIQWVYGAGHGPAAHWLPVYKRIQAKGKNSEVLCESIEDAREVMAACAPDGLWLAVAGSYDRQTVDAFLQEVAHWSQRKK